MRAPLHERNQLLSSYGHSIIASARTSSAGSTARRIALRSLSTKTSSNEVGCSVGSSSGLAPLSIKSKAGFIAHQATRDPSNSRIAFRVARSWPQSRRCDPTSIGNLGRSVPQRVCALTPNRCERHVPRALEHRSAGCRPPRRALRADKRLT